MTADPRAVVLAVLAVRPAVGSTITSATGLPLPVVMRALTELHQAGLVDRGDLDHRTGLRAWTTTTPTPATHQRRADERNPHG